MCSSYSEDVNQISGSTWGLGHFKHLDVRTMESFLHRKQTILILYYIHTYVLNLGF